MNMVIVLEIVLGIGLLAAAVRFAVRDVQQRSSEGPQQQAEPEPTPQEHGAEHQPEQHPSPVADRS